MGIVVKKFGGTSVESTEKIKRIAKHLASTKKDKIVAVVSAMGKTTNDLLNLAYQITQNPNQREMDMLVTAGERITMALLSLSLQEQKKSSISFTGSQSGIITDNSHGNAKILAINPVRIPVELKKGKIVIVAGFQGVSLEKEITTLGRGGSDTSAVALACFLGADKCEIFTDVDGVYTADPRYVKNAQKLQTISHDDMLYMTYAGSKVLHSRAAEFAHKYNIPVEIKSSLNFKEGTMIKKMSKEKSQTPKNDIVECSTVCTMTHKENILVFEVSFPDNKLPYITTEIFDMELSEGFYKFYIEKRFETAFLAQVGIPEKDMEQNPEYCVINLLGYRICRDYAFFMELNELLKKKCKQEFSIKNQGIGVQIMVNQAEASKVIKFLNNKYIQREE
ncbi:MAG: aspartate kinase [Candidatus Cloacimonetes bacterium]|nr:aspartate kinase [Candidatus Cloacimonadota bacterium]